MTVTHLARKNEALEGNHAYMSYLKLADRWQTLEILRPSATSQPLCLRLGSEIAAGISIFFLFDVTVYIY